MTNLIVSSYLTSAIDTQRGVYTRNNNPEYIRKWYDSLVRLGLNGVVLHDNLSSEFMSMCPSVEFVRVCSCPENMQLYDFRWILYRQFLYSRDGIDNVFFTDISDVEVINDPFPFIESGMLYCGDEPDLLSQCTWLDSARENVMLKTLDEFNDVLNYDKLLLNAGILGGNTVVVKDFLDCFSRLITQCAARPIERTADMALFNYIMYYNCFDVIHGHPVNSVFRGGKNETDVWFRHK